MKKTLFTLASALLWIGSLMAENISERTAKAWEDAYPQIESRIKAPTFRDKDFNINNFQPKNKKNLKTDKYGEVLYTDVINSAIAKCSAEGGGRVIIPAGTWLTGPVKLLSNVNLHLEEGARLLFTSDPHEYYPLVLTAWEGINCWNWCPMIYAYKQDNIAITGKGTIDGGASRSAWWSLTGKEKWGWSAGMPSQRAGRIFLEEWDENGVDLFERRLGSNWSMRPQLVNTVECSNVLVEDVTMTRAAFWSLHPLMCKNVTVRGITVQSDGPDSDGCNPESCKDVLIEDCSFDMADNCISIKSGRNRDGAKRGIPSENIIVRNCLMKNGRAGVMVGSEMSGDCRSIFVEKCKMEGSGFEQAIGIATNGCRGGVVEDVYFRDIDAARCRNAVFEIDMNFDPKEACKRAYPPTVRNISLDNVVCGDSGSGVLIAEEGGNGQVYDIDVKDCYFNGVEYTKGRPLAYRLAKAAIAGKQTGTAIDGVAAAANAYGNKEMLDYVLADADLLVNADGSIKGYIKEDYDIEAVNNGIEILKAYDLSGNAKYKIAADNIYSQLLSQPRTKSKNFQHRKDTPSQVWLSDLYMAQPFYADYVKRYLNADSKLWDDIAGQFITIGKKTYDQPTGLYRHAWDEKKKQPWADRRNGQSDLTLACAMGRYLWAITDVLEKMPENHPKRAEMVQLLKNVANGVVKYQNPQAGVWYNVMDSPSRSGNYLDATASAMFVYNMLRAVRLGLLDQSYLAPAKRGYECMVQSFVKENPDGSISLVNCCTGSAPAGSDNDAATLTPFILASLEYDALK